MQTIPFLHCAQYFIHTSPFTILFPSSSFSFSLLNNFIIFPLQCFLFPSSTSTSSFILYIFPSTNTRPPIDPTSTPHSTFFNTASWILKLYTTTTTTFLLFSLHHHHHHHISIAFPPPPPPPPPHFYWFSSTTTTTATTLLLETLRCNDADDNENVKKKQ